MSWVFQPWPSTQPDVDELAPWVREADESYQLPGVAAADTYLNQEAILTIANNHGVDAIHPGYGFLKRKCRLCRGLYGARSSLSAHHRKPCARWVARRPHGP
ncbi:MAG: biotin carboxylase N-terminal domain-containing protein [Chloroflexota bacterium]